MPIITPRAAEVYDEIPAIKLPDDTAEDDDDLAYLNPELSPGKRKILYAVEMARSTKTRELRSRQENVARQEPAGANPDSAVTEPIKIPHNGDLGVGYPSQNERVGQHGSVIGLKRSSIATHEDEAMTGSSNSVQISDVARVRRNQKKRRLTLAEALGGDSEVGVFRSFPVKIAKELGKGGVTAALVLLTIATWINSKNGKGLYKEPKKGLVWAYRSTRQLAKELPFFGHGCHGTIYKAIKRLGKANKLLVDSTGSKNRHSYDFTLRFAIPKDVMYGLFGGCVTFELNHAVEYGICSAIVLGNLVTQMSIGGIKGVSFEGETYYELSPGKMASLIGFSRWTIIDALKDLTNKGVLIKHPELSNYYCADRASVAKVNTPLKISELDVAKVDGVVAKVNRGVAKVNDNTDSNIDGNIDRNAEYYEALPATRSKLRESQNSPKLGLNLLKDVMEESLIKLRARLATGMPLVNYDNLNDPDCDYDGELTQYEPLRLEEKISDVKGWIKVLRGLPGEWKFSYEAEDLNELRKFFCCNRNVNSDLISSMIGDCKLIQQEEDDKWSRGAGIVLSGSDQFCPRLRRIKFDFYRWVRQCHNLKFFLDHFEDIFLQLFKFKDGEWAHRFSSRKYRFSMEVVYHWRPQRTIEYRKNYFNRDALEV